MKHVGLIFVFIFFNLNAFAQHLHIVNDKGEAIKNAILYIPNVLDPILSDSIGEIEFDKTYLNQKAIIKCIGYQTDTVLLLAKAHFTVILKADLTLKTVEISQYRDGIEINSKSISKIENITQTELKKAACCDLAGCFETQSSVQPQTTNIVTNSKELRVLGLSGVYNQILIDGLPIIVGLNYTYGISSFSGNLINNISISKGTNSVLQGFESISGQVNIETKKPNLKEKYFVNMYINSFLEKQFNIQTQFKVKKWKGLLATYLVLPGIRVDKDKDSFLDIPLLNRQVLWTKWKYGNGQSWGWHTDIGFRLLHENRVGGQLDYKRNSINNISNPYGNEINIVQPELWAKTIYKLNQFHAISFYNAHSLHYQKSIYGTLNYDAFQNYHYFNLQYAWDPTPKLALKTGLSYRHLDIKEQIDFSNDLETRTYKGDYIKHEKIPGIFLESNVIIIPKKLDYTFGIRIDKHNQFGYQYTPRSMFKFDINPKLVLRGNIGTGWRTVNLFSENNYMLASSRNILFLETLKPEKALNTGLNLTQKFDSKIVSGHISIDAYHTKFNNQFFPDYDSNSSFIVIKNFEGKSISNILQLDVLLKYLNQYELKIGYNFIDVFRIVKDQKVLLPFNPRHKLLLTGSYISKSKLFKIDANMHWFGIQRLANTKQNPIEYQIPEFSKPFSVIGIQFTYKINQLELYFGSENIMNFRQNRPILSWQNPYSPYFDITSVWGPTRGRELYFGLRYTVF